MSAPKKPIREIPFDEIDRQFAVLEYAHLGIGPAVGARADNVGGFYIRVAVGMTYSGGTTRTRFDYFHLGPDGEVQAAPRGFAKDFKPGRVTGMAEAVRKAVYADLTLHGDLP